MLQPEFLAGVGRSDCDNVLCTGDYEIFEEEIDKLLKDEKFSAISDGRAIHGKV